MRASILRLLPLAIVFSGCVIREVPPGSMARNQAPAPMPAGNSGAATPPAATAATPTVTPSTPSGVIGAPAGTAVAGAPPGAVAGAPPGAVVAGGFKQNLIITGPSVFGEPTASPGSIRGDIYELPEGIKMLPDFSKLTPVGALYSTQWNVPSRDFKEGFPGVSGRTEWFGIRWDGAIQVANGGTFTVRVVSDDGSKVYLDGILVVDDDGQHAAKEAKGQHVMSSGQHRITVEYFQGPRWTIALQVFISSPQLAERPLTTSF